MKKYAAATKAYFTVKAGKTKVAQLTHGELFPSFTIIIGAHLTRKLISFYGSVFTVRDDNADPEAEGVNVVLGSTSNMTTRSSPTFVSADKVGKCHAIIRLAAAVTPEWRKQFPHGPDFLPTAAPSLATFITAGNKNAPHVVAIIPVAHPNNWGVDDVPNRKLSATTQQLFGDAHGSRGENWYDAASSFDPAVTPRTQRHLRKQTRAHHRAAKDNQKKDNLAQWR